VFDLGGVIVRICRSWPEACEHAGVSVRAGWDDPSLKAARRELNKQHQEGRLDCQAFFEGLAATSPGLYTADEVRRIHDAWTLDEYPGAGALVRRLHEHGVATGVLSNTNHAHWRRLAPPAHLEATEYPTPRMVRHLHASHLMGLTKPDEAIYREFARRTGFHPAQIVFFDDMEENVVAARQAGWKAVQVDHAGDTVAQMSRVLESMRVL
jgi:HAD superfamily hydrolase (TIGR01509 family)